MLMPKRLLYLFTSTFEHAGLAAKAKGQAAAFSTHCEVDLQVFNYTAADSSFKKAIKALAFSIRGALKSLSASSVYMRYNPKFFGLTLKVAFFSFFKPVFLEHNIDLNRELVHLHRPIELFFHTLLMRIVRFFPVYHVVVTREIGEIMQAWGVDAARVLYVQNGYTAPDISALSCDTEVISRLKAFLDPIKTCAVFTGNGYKWHGLDDVLAWISAYPNIQLVVIGPYEASPQPNVLWLGKQTPATIFEVYTHCHFGIGSFRYDMIGLTQASPLKTREYLCQGLPILINYKDTAKDIPALRPYIFSLDRVDELLVFEYDKNRLAALAQQELSWGKSLGVVIDRLR
jgi:hypothetical protein